MSCCDAGAFPLLTYCVTAGTTAAASTAMTVTVTRISGSVKPLRCRLELMCYPLGSRNRQDQQLQRIGGSLPIADRARGQIAVVELAVERQRAQRVVHRHDHLEDHVTLSRGRACRSGRQQRVDLEARLEGKTAARRNAARRTLAMGRPAPARD